MQQLHHSCDAVDWRSLRSLRVALALPRQAAGFPQQLQSSLGRGRAAAYRRSCHWQTGAIPAVPANSNDRDRATQYVRSSRSPDRAIEGFGARSLCTRGSVSCVRVSATGQRLPLKSAGNSALARTKLSVENSVTLPRSYGPATPTPMSPASRASMSEPRAAGCQASSTRPASSLRPLSWKSQDATETSVTECVMGM